MVDTFDGLTFTGNSLNLRVRYADAERFGLTADDIAAAVNTAMLGQVASTVLQGDRVVAIRVMADPKSTAHHIARTPSPHADRVGGASGASRRCRRRTRQVELRREDLRQDVAVTARLEGRDLGSAMAEIRAALVGRKRCRPGG